MGDTAIVLSDLKDVIVGKIAVQPSERKVVGRVVDEYDKPLPGASVVIKNSRQGVATDADGKFSFTVNKNRVIIVVSYIGYITKEFEAVANSEIKPIKLAMNEMSIIGEVVFVRPNKKRQSQVEKKTLLNTFSQCVYKVFKNGAFTIYPNPVNKNGTINISVKETGVYEVQILSNQSKLLYSQQHSTQAAKQVIQVALPSGAIAGMYYVRLLNTVTHKQWVDKMMVQ